MTAVWDLKSQYDTHKGNTVFDCSIAEHLLSEGRYPITLQEAYTRHQVQSLEDLANVQQSLLASHHLLSRLYTDIEYPLIHILATMEQRGIRVDTRTLSHLGEEIEKEKKEKEQIITNELGDHINLASPAQIGAALVAKWNIPLKKTATGQYATSEKELLPLSPQYPILQDILKLREVSKLMSTYISPLLSKISDDGRIHTTYHQIGAISGRMSSSDPNMQNIPATTPIGKKIKSCFCSSEGSLLLSLDYSQQELRILAHMSQEDTLIRSFSEGKDIHITTAAQLFSVSEHHVTPEQRAIAKTINFGIVYGMSSFGLSKSLSIPVDQAQTFIDTFNTTFPNIGTYYEHLIKQGEKQGYIETILGRRRYVFSDPKQKFVDPSTRRELINFPIQGSAADMIKHAMVQIDADILQKRPDIHMLLQVHDELVFEIETEDIKKAQNAADQIAHIMKTAQPLSVPLEVSTHIGKRWEK